MLARSWDGVTRADQGDEYVEYLRRTGVADLLATAGNRGVYVLRREEGGRTRFRLVSLWDSGEAIRGFAGDDPERARYYPEDQRFLLALTPGVEHFEVAIGPDPNLPREEAAQIAAELRAVGSGEAFHGPSLRDVLEGVTAERAAARPIGAAHSLWEIVLHITAWNRTWVQRLDGRVVDEPEEGDFPPVPSPTEEAWNETRSRALASQEALADRVTRLSAAELGAAVPNRDFDVRSMLKGAVRHTVYHGGQAALLAKATLEVSA